jgi:hypothetical protein
VDYKNYRKKYLVIDKRIKDEKSFINLYGGYPLFWQENKLNEHFYDDECNVQWDARRAQAQDIPKIYRSIL